MTFLKRLFFVLSLVVIICPTAGVCKVEIIEKYSDTYLPIGVYLVFGGDTVLIKLDVTNNLICAGLVPSKLAVIPWQGGGYRMLPSTSDFNKDSTVFMQCLTGSPSDSSTRANTYKVDQKGDCQYICQTKYFSALVNEFENGNILVVDYGFNTAGKYVVKTHLFCHGIISDSSFPVKRSYDYGSDDHSREYDMFEFFAPDTVLFVAAHDVYYGYGNWALSLDSTVLKFNRATGIKQQRRSLPLINYNHSSGQIFDLKGRRLNVPFNSNRYSGIRIIESGKGCRTRVSVR